MINYKKISVVIFVSVLVLISPLAGSVWAAEPTAPPTITGISPTTTIPDQPIEIYGTNLSSKITLVSSGGQTTETTTGWIEDSLTLAGFQVPLDAQPGSYKITVTNTKGSTTSTASLTISVGGAAIPPQITITPPTQGLPTNLGQLISQIFTWSLGILGISVFVMFFYSGFLWLTAAGNTSKVGEARGHMTNAVFGAILLLSSYLILYTINPDFVKNTVNLPGLGTTTTGTNPPGSGGNPNSICKHTGGNSDYSGALRSAIDTVIATNTGSIADALNTSANGFTILGLVAEELQKSGFNATTNVKNGNDSPNQGDLIALWRSADTTVERYDAIKDSGLGNDLLRNKMGTDYVGDIPLSCVF